MRLLIVEDEENTLKYLHKGFDSHGFIVVTANNGEDGLFIAETHQFDLIILDIMLPKLNGWEIIKRLRMAGRDMPIICLTAKDTVDDRVQGLEYGADDYLIKPFAFTELLARVKALMRRGQNEYKAKVNIADLEIDLIARKVIRANSNIKLTSKEFNLLVLLAKRQGQVLSRTIIMEQVWDINFDTDTNVVDVAIRRLRNKVDKSFAKPLIHTIRGVGYMLDESSE